MSSWKFVSSTLKRTQKKEGGKGGCEKGGGKTSRDSTHPEQPQRGPEDLHHQDLDEQRRVRRVRQRRRGPHHAHAEPTREVGPARRQARREQRVAGRVGGQRPGTVRFLVDVFYFRLQDDGDDDAVDGDGLAEDDAERTRKKRGGGGVFFFGQRGSFSLFQSATKSSPSLSFFAFSVSTPTGPPHLIRFLDVILGSRTAAPSSDEPVMKMPLLRVEGERFSEVEVEE